MGGLLFLIPQIRTKVEARHYRKYCFYKMLAVCALFLRFQSYVITFLGITANVPVVWAERF